MARMTFRSVLRKFGFEQAGTTETGEGTEASFFHPYIGTMATHVIPDRHAPEYVTFWRNEDDEESVTFFTPENMNLFFSGSEKWKPER